MRIDLLKSIRNFWEVKPVTKVVADKKKFNKKKERSKKYSEKSDY